MHLGTLPDLRQNALKLVVVLCCIEKVVLHFFLNHGLLLNLSNVCSVAINIVK